MATRPQRGVRPAIIATAIIVGFIVFLVIGTAVILARAFQSANDIAYLGATSNVNVVATNFQWVNQTSKQLLQRVDDFVGANLDSLPTNALGFMKDAVASLPGDPRIYLVSADGKTSLTTDPDFKPIDIRDRPYFKAVQNGEKFYVSPMITSRLNGDSIFVVSKRIERGGKFVGAAIISFNDELIKQVWTSLRLDENSSIVVVKDNGEVVARYPEIANRPNISSSDLFTKYLPTAASGSYDTVSTVDGIRRIVAYRRVDNSDLVTTATIKYKFAFAQFYKFTFLSLAIALPLFLFLLFIAWSAYHWMTRDAHQREALEHSLETNKMLFREIHHRVKNNLQAVNSLVNLQKIDADAKRGLSQRILAMIAVHEQIYENDQFQLVEANAYIPSIVGKLVESYGSDVTVNYDLEEIEVDREHALPLGLITNEVVSNSLKHGIMGDGDGVLNVSFRKHDEGRTAILVLRDNGVGFDMTQPSSGMGTKLLAGLVAQLQGESRVWFDQGTVFELRIPLPDTSKA